MLGYNVRYNGTNKLNDKLLDILKDHELIPICPEQLATFPIPHLPLEIKNNKVFDESGKDVTKQLQEGSIKAYELIKDCDFLVLKTKSPSCGYRKIYDGTFSGKIINGNGVFTDIALKNNKKVFSEEDLELIITYLTRSVCNH